MTERPSLGEAALELAATPRLIFEEPALPTIFAKILTLFVCLLKHRNNVPAPFRHSMEVLCLFSLFDQQQIASLLRRPSGACYYAPITVCSIYSITTCTLPYLYPKLLTINQGVKFSFFQCCLVPLRSM
jgi:hypothetical protein